MLIGLGENPTTWVASEPQAQTFVRVRLRDR